MATFSKEEILFELGLKEPPPEVMHEFELCRLRDTCKQYGITFTEAWLSATGRIGLAQVIAAKVSGRDAAGLERDWLVMLEGGDNG